MSAMTMRRALAALVGLVFFAMSLPAAACDLSCLFHVKQNSRCEFAANAAGDSKGASNGWNAAMAARCAHCGAGVGESHSVTARAIRLEQALADGSVPASQCVAHDCTGRVCDGAFTLGVAGSGQTAQRAFGLRHLRVALAAGGALDGLFDLRRGGVRILFSAVSSRKPELSVALRI
jgi:hypothetical protein